MPKKKTHDMRLEEYLINIKLITKRKNGMMV